MLTTALIPTPLRLEGHTRERAIKTAINEAMAEAAACFVCRQRVSRPGAFLCAWGDAAAVAVAQCCPECWHSSTDAEIETGAVRVLRGAVPGGRFLDAR